VTVLAINSSTLWYLTRGTGVVSLLLLTASVALGVVGAVGWNRPGWPRFLTTGLHRNLSLLVLAFLAVHIGTAVADSYAPITLAQAVIPFTSSYRPIWLGLGALAFDMLLAILITSLARKWLGFRAWRTIHWLAYASWPVAVVHGLGTGTDTGFTWMIALTGACVATVVGCVWWRAGTGSVSGRGRSGIFAASVAVPLIIGAWYVTGPLQAGWSRRAGTPIALIRSAGVSQGSLTSNVVDVPSAPFRDRILGSLTETSPDQTGTVAVAINAHVTGAARGTLAVTLRGQPLSDGTIQIDSGTVTFGPPSRPGLYTGPVFVASDGRLVATVTGGRAPIDLRLQLAVDHSTGAVTGVLDADQSQGGALAPPGVDNDGQERES
jgi:methionine sulfoxide reductase heme-binding subunit